MAPTALVAVIAVMAGATAIGGVAAAPAAAAECPTGVGFPRAHSNWIGRVIETGLGPVGECAAAYTGGPRRKKTTSCQPVGQIRLAFWGTWQLGRDDYITVRTYVEVRHDGKWLGATKTNLKQSFDTRPGKADRQLRSSQLKNFRLHPIDGWLQFHAEHTWGVSGFISGEMVRVHVVIHWKTAARGIADPSRATFDERIGPYCIAQPDDDGRRNPGAINYGHGRG